MICLICQKANCNWLDSYELVFKRMPFCKLSDIFSYYLVSTSCETRLLRPELIRHAWFNILKPPIVDQRLKQISERKLID